MKIYLWVYTFILAFLIWLFIVAKIHAYDYKSFSPSIIPVTKFLFITLVILTILWYTLIIFFSNNNTLLKKDNSWYFKNEISY